MIASRHFEIGWLRRLPGRCCALLAMVISLVLTSVSSAQQPLNVFDETAEIDDADAEFYDPEAAQFDSWDPIFSEDSGDSMYCAPHEGPRLTPFDWVRHLGFRHSSTHGRHVGRGLPLEGSSWMNRPYHIDWFSGPLLGDDLVDNTVAQDNELFGGLRIGWDVDYYWGLETRFGWANPNVQFIEPQPVADNGSYFISDVSLLYYPWGDSKVRPYMLLGGGMARIDFVDAAQVNFNTTLFTMPFGGGIQLRQSPSIAWRFEVLDNLSFGADGVDTMHNVSLTAGMEFRFGARPSSYWPWRASRRYW